MLSLKHLAAAAVLGVAMLAGPSAANAVTPHHTTALHSITHKKKKHKTVHHTLKHKRKHKTSTTTHTIRAAATHRKTKTALHAKTARKTVKHLTVKAVGRHSEL